MMEVRPRELAEAGLPSDGNLHCLPWLLVVPASSHQPHGAAPCGCAVAGHASVERFLPHQMNDGQPCEGLAAVAGKSQSCDQKGLHSMAAIHLFAAAAAASHRGSRKGCHEAEQRIQQTLADRVPASLLTPHGAQWSISVQ